MRRSFVGIRRIRMTGAFQLSDIWGSPPALRFGIVGVFLWGGYLSFVTGEKLETA